MRDLTNVKITHFIQNDIISKLKLQHVLKGIINLV